MDRGFFLQGLMLPLTTGLILVLGCVAGAANQNGDDTVLVWGNRLLLD